MTIIRKTYPQGDSTGVTIPKKFGIRPGIHMTFKKENKKIIMEPLIK